MTTARPSPLAHACVLGLDFGTAAVRAVIVHARDGTEASSATAHYRSAAAGVITDPAQPDLARQHPQNWIDAAYESTRAALLAARSRDPAFDPARIAAIGIDTTASTPLPVDDNCQPLCSPPEGTPDSSTLAWLWKDHTAHAEAAEIVDRVRTSGLPFLRACGDTYSSEWFWAKALRFARTSPAAGRARAWIEQCDWIPAQLCAVTDPARAARSACAAGHKAMYHRAWGGWPAPDFLAALHPLLSQWSRSCAHAAPSDTRAGALSAHAAARMGLIEGTPVSVGCIDAHAGAIGAGVGPGIMVKVLGTSSCDCLVAPLSPNTPGVQSIPGLCGCVPDSILPGFLGIEAGQAGVGDIFDWFVRLLGSAPEQAARTHEQLSRDAARLEPGESGLLALDWHNGNRNVLADQRLTGLLIGQTLATEPAHIYRALIEATAFGALRIVRRIEESSGPVREIVVCGGIAAKNPLVLDIYADVLNRPIRVAAAENASALGACVLGAAAAGLHASVLVAQRAMVGPPARTHRPDGARARVYAELDGLYEVLHDAFGLRAGDAECAKTARGRAPGAFEVMKRLLDIRDRARAGV